MASQSSGDRLMRLEENAYYLEEQLKALDEQVLKQQASIDNLSKQVESLRSALGEIRDLLSAAPGPAEKPDASLPPHHVARFW